MLKSISKIPHIKFHQYVGAPASAIDRMKDLIKQTNSIYDEIAQLKSHEINVENVIHKLSDFERKTSREIQEICFAQHVSNSEELRKASVEAEKILSENSVKLSMRKDVYKIFEELQMKDLKIDGETKRLLDHSVRDYRRNGVHLSEDIREKMEKLSTEESQLSIDFSSNLAEENTRLYFTREELVGMDEDFVNSLDVVNDKYELTLKYPHFIPIMDYCECMNTREQMEFAFNSRCKDENIPVLKRLIEIRNEKSKLLGFKNHVDFVTEVLMSKSSAEVYNFLQRLRGQMKDIFDSDYQLIKKYAPGNDMKPFNIALARKRIEKEVFNVDSIEVQKYFPMEHVLSNILAIYQEVLELSFVDVTGDLEQKWDENIKYYQVSNGEKLLGYFYLDLFPRDGKFSHAALFTLQSGHTPENGSYVPAIAALVCNFTKPTSDKPSLLTHEEVETLFHEFGHCMHAICGTRPKYSDFSGTHVETDFVECPSQAFENFVWEEPVLRRISSHYQTSDPLPDTLLQSIINSRKACVGYATMRQISLAMFDYEAHVRTDVTDLCELYADIARDYVNVLPSPGTSFPSTFGHLAGGYDGQYYSYLYSEIFAADCYYTGFRYPQSAVRFRDEVLAKGGSIDGGELLKQYLGREPDEKSFLLLRGLM